MLAVQLPVGAQQPDTVDRFQQFYGYGALIKGGEVRPQWMADGHSFWFRERSGDSVDLKRVDPVTNQVKPLLDVARVRNALRGALGHEPKGPGFPFDSVRLVDENRTAEFQTEGQSFTLSLGDYRIARLPATDSTVWHRIHPRLVRKNYPITDDDTYELASPDGTWFAFERHKNITLRSSKDDHEMALTSDGGGDTEWILDNLDWGLGEGKGGAQWSPNGRKLAALRRNVKGVAWMPIIHWLKPNEEIEWQWYPRAGQPLAVQDVYVIDVGTGGLTRVDLGDVTDHFTSIVGWLPDGSEVIVARMDREYKQLDFLTADPVTGKTRLLVSERQPTFIKGIEGSPGLGGMFHLLPDGKRFVLISERDGWDHLYLYDISGSLIRRLTSGKWPVTQLVGADLKAGWVYFLAHAESRLYDSHLYRVGLDGGGFQRLTEGPGMHQISMSPSRQYFVDTRSTVDQPPIVELHQANGRLLRTLSQADISGLIQVGWRPPEEFWVKASDGVTDLRGVLYQPRHFDASRKYPVVEYIYGGPQAVNAPRAFIANANALAMSQLGFVTFVLDARGTPERGKAFQDVVYGNFGRNEIPDHVAALKQLATRHPYMDLGRVGIFGGSWGGYMTIRALVLAPETYHVGLAIYPVADLINHHQMIEAYMGTPEHNPTGYEYASSLRLADHLKGKLMLLHGTSDVNAPFSSTIQMVDALTRAGKRYDLVILPEQNHGILPQNASYWLETMRKFFVESLRPEETGTGGKVR